MDMNKLIVLIVGLIALILTGGAVTGFLLGVADVTVLTAIISSVITGLLGIVVGKGLE